MSRGNKTRTSVIFQIVEWIQMRVRISFWLHADHPFRNMESSHSSAHSYNYWIRYDKNFFCETCFCFHESVATSWQLSGVLTICKLEITTGKGEILKKELNIMKHLFCPQHIIRDNRFASKWIRTLLTAIFHYILSSVPSSDANRFIMNYGRKGNHIKTVYHSFRSAFVMLSRKNIDFKFLIRSIRVFLPIQTFP